MASLTGITNQILEGGQSVVRALQENVPTAAPLTKTRTSYAFSLQVQLPHGAPRLIGAVQNISFSQSREIDEEYEIEVGSRGLPVDLVPQRLTERTMRVERLDLYLNLFEEVFNSKEILILTDQFMPLMMRELWRDPAGGNILATASRSYVYTGVFVKSLGRRVASSGDMIVHTDALFVYRDRIRIL